MFLFCVYDSSSDSPSSRPIPDFLYPPNSAPIKCEPTLLIQTKPDSTLAASLCARTRLVDHIEAVSPYSSALTCSIKESSSSQGITASTGPKASSRNRRMSGVTSANTVGSMNHPFSKAGSLGLPPPQMSRAPSLRAESIKSMTLLNWAWEIRQPMVVSGSVGMPQRCALAIRPGSTSRNLSYWLRCTQHLDVDPHDCPAHVKFLPPIAPFVALSKSASGQIMRGFLPPSSNVTGMIFSALDLRTATPVSVEPISVTRLTSGCLTRASPHSRSPLTIFST